MVDRRELVRAAAWRGQAHAIIEKNQHKKVILISRAERAFAHSVGNYVPSREPWFKRGGYCRFLQIKDNAFS